MTILSCVDMIFRREKRKIPQLNTTSTADISFMLLIFFLVTTSMDMDKVLSRQIPPLVETEEMEAEMHISARNILRIHIRGNNQVLVNDEPASVSAIKNRVEAFVENARNSDQLPEKHERIIALLGKCMVTDKHVIQVKADRSSSYETYFSVQNEIVAAYQTLRNRLARQRFGRAYPECSEEQQGALREYYPQRISEVYLEEEEGGAI